MSLSIGPTINRPIRDISSKLQYVRGYKPVLKPCQDESDKIASLRGPWLDNEIKYWSFLNELESLFSKKSALKITARRR